MLVIKLKSLRNTFNNLNVTVGINNHESMIQFDVSKFKDSNLDKILDILNDELDSMGLNELSELLGKI